MCAFSGGGGGGGVGVGGGALTPLSATFQSFVDCAEKKFLIYLFLYLRGIKRTSLYIT